MTLIIRIQALWPFPLGKPGPRWTRRALQTDDRTRREACLERAAATGDLEGMVLLGDFHATHGQRERALPLFRAAAEGGHPVGAFGYAELLRWEFPGGARGLKESFRWYVKAAEEGFGPAIAWLAHAYETGEGVEQSEARAQAWAMRPATLVWPPATPRRRSLGWHPVETGLAYWETLNLWVGQYATRPWYPFALAALLVVTLDGIFGWMGAPGCGLGLAFLILATFCLSVVRGPYQRRLSTRRLERDARAGDRDARHRLGLAYRDGSHDVPRDRILACRELRVAAEAGQVQAMVDLAELLWWGLGSDYPDRGEAQRWFERARALGHPGLEGGEQALRLAATPVAVPEAGRVEARLGEVRHRWQHEVGPRLSRTLLVGASICLFGLLVHLTYRNTAWLGRRDRGRVVWGDMQNRVSAPKDPMATLPIQAPKRLRVEPFRYALSLKEGGQEADRCTEAFLGRPALLVLVRGQFPAFRESLFELNGLVKATGDRASFLVGHILGAEPEQAAAGVLSWFAHTDFPDVPFGVVHGGTDQPALGDLTHTPVTFVLDRQGRVRQRWQGYQPGLMKEALAAALADPQ